MKKRLLSNKMLCAKLLCVSGINELQLMILMISHLISMPLTDRNLLHIRLCQSSAVQ